MNLDQQHCPTMKKTKLRLLFKRNTVLMPEHSQRSQLAEKLRFFNKHHELHKIIYQYLPQGKDSFLAFHIRQQIIAAYDFPWRSNVFYWTFGPQENHHLRRFFMLQKYRNYHLKVGRCYHTIIVRNGYYQRHMSCIFDFLVNPEMEKKEGVGFFFV